eukprot:TRINITY_DN18096_c0_g1_i1.p1 TRINITY_DN18096_c0_g1~~TRINITY_DN18096_c0_g1_i1.p1  ORF type:complete len:995 (-),score=188.66 TRINITY_DN18096_c0_g1_i1:112-3096(-)
MEQQVPMMSGFASETGSDVGAAYGHTKVYRAPNSEAFKTAGKREQGSRTMRRLLWLSAAALVAWTARVQTGCEQSLAFARNLRVARAAAFQIPGGAKVVKAGAGEKKASPTWRTSSSRSPTDAAEKVTVRTINTQRWKTSQPQAGITRTVSTPAWKTSQPQTGVTRPVSTPSWKTSQPQTGVTRTPWKRSATTKEWKSSGSLSSYEFGKKSAPSSSSGYGKKPAPSSSFGYGNKPATTDLNVDIFKLPLELLPFDIWQCKSTKGGGPKPFSWQEKGWVRIANIVKTKVLNINLKQQGKQPSFDGCEGAQVTKVKKEKLSSEEYALLVGMLLEHQALKWKPGQDGDGPPARQVSHLGQKVQLVPKFRFRGLEIGGNPYLYVTVKQEQLAPEHMNLAKVPKHAAASMVGLKVRPTGQTDLFEVCEPCQDEIELTSKYKTYLLDLIKTYQVKKITEQAPLGELLVCVSRNCADEKQMNLTYVASAVRPSISTEEHRQALQRLPGFEGWTPIPTRTMLLQPKDRQTLIRDAISCLTDQMGLNVAEPLSRATKSDAAGDIEFMNFQKPVVEFGRNHEVRVPSGNQLWKSLSQYGLFHQAVADGPKAKLSGIMFGTPTSREKAGAQDVLKAVQRKLKEIGVDIQEGGLHEAGTNIKNGQTAVRDSIGEAGVQPGDAVLLFGTSALHKMDKKARTSIKTSVLLEKDKGDALHVANQWIDLANTPLWVNKKFDYAVMNVVLGLSGKMGHAPWGLRTPEWVKPKEDVKVAVVGYDVCHLKDPASKNKRDIVHIAAGVRVSSSKKPDVLSDIAWQSQVVKTESVPDDKLRSFIPEDFAMGKVVIIHRDGDFTLQELKFLKAYQKELAGKAPGTSFVLVEVVKWQGGTPRVYKGDVNAPQGTAVKLSPEEVILVSSDARGGTANPLLVRLQDRLGEDAHKLEEDAWVRSVFDLSFIHHGSVFMAPRLPVTTFFADRLAYQLADGGEDFAEKFADATTKGSQQFFL